MAVSTFVGSLTTNTSTGLQSVTGVGFEPKAVIFWATHTVVVGSNNEMRSTFGCATSSTAEWNVHSHVNQGGVTSGCEFQGDRVFRVINGDDDAAVVSASFSSMDADGFTVNLNVASATQFTIYFMAIGGTSVEAQAGHFDVPNVDGTVSVDGMSFDPKATIFGFGPANNTDLPAADAMMGIGWGISSTSAASSNYYSQLSSVVAGKATQIQSVGLALTRIDPNAGHNLSATYQNDTGGFTIDVDQVANGVFTVGYLSLGGSAEYSMLRFNEPPAIGVRTYTVDISPQAMLFMTNGIAPTSDISTSMRRSFGAASVSTVTTSGDDLPPTGYAFYEPWTLPLTAFGTAVDGRPNTTVQATGGTNSTGGLRVAYVGGTMGSERVLQSYSVATAQVYSLWYDVLFEDGFDFANGGKMHGLYPTNPVTGGNTVTSDSWSARVMWRANGRLQSYVYHQDMGGTFGSVVQNNSFYLQRNQWYAFTAIVRVNDFGTSNGYMQIWVDGVLLINHQNIRFRAVDTTASLINQVTFNTFHGGNDVSYAPRDANGNVTTVYARYDNFSATAGAHVKPPVGTSTPTTTTTILRRVDGLYNVAGANSASMPVTYRSSLNCVATCGATQQTSAATADLTAVGPDSFTLNWTKVSTRESEIVAFLIGDSAEIQVSAAGIGATGGVGSTTVSGKAGVTLTGLSATASLGTATGAGTTGSISVQAAVTGLEATSSLGTTEQFGSASVEAEAVGMEAIAQLGEVAHFEYVLVPFLPVAEASMAPLGGLVTTTSRFGLSGDWNPDDGLPTDGSGSCWLSQRP